MNTGTARSRAKHLENSKGWRSAPRSKSAKPNPKRRMSQATEKMYFKWKLSETRLQESKLTAATYRDILMSNPVKAPPAQMKPHGLALAASALVPPPAVPRSTPGPAIMSPPSPPINLGPIMAQLEAITAALAAVGIKCNLN